MFKRGQKVRLLVHGAGVVSEEKGVVRQITKKGVYLDNGPGNDPSGPFDPKTGRNVEDGVFGFWQEIKPAK